MLSRLASHSCTRSPSPNIDYRGFPRRIFFCLSGTGDKDDCDVEKTSSPSAPTELGLYFELYKCRLLHLLCTFCTAALICWPVQGLDSGLFVYDNIRTIS